MEDFFETAFNEKTGKWSLWMNGKIVKMASQEITLLREVEKRGGIVS